MTATASGEECIQRLMTAFEGPRRLIALAGVPGSGKSTLAAHMADAVNARMGRGTIAALGMDGFHLSQAELRRRPGADALFARRGAPWTFDAAALADRLHALRDDAGRHAVPWPEFRHEIGDPAEGGLVVPPETRLILVEGLYLLSRDDGWEAVSRRFDERWYLDTPLDIALERLAARHVAAWGISRETAERRIASNDRLNAEIVLKTRAFSDLLVMG